VEQIRKDMPRFGVTLRAPPPREKRAKEVDECDRDCHCEQHVSLAHRNSLPYGRNGPAYATQRRENPGSDPEQVNQRQDP
jgi:hypothetical protein